MRFTAAILGMFCFVAISQDEEEETPKKVTVTFNGVETGKLPEGWKVDATGTKPKLADWQVEKDSESTNRNKFLSITKINSNSGSIFNLCWSEKIKFRNGSIEARIRANSGVTDEGGGIMWRVKDNNNYYVARYNPLEKNFRLYHVKDGVRTQLKDASKLNIPAGKWFTMKIEHFDERIKCFLNDKLLLEADDETFEEAGGVGFWSKADAATSFDDLVVDPTAKETESKKKSEGDD